MGPKAYVPKMTRKAESDDPRLARVTRICLSLPEGMCERYGSHATYRVRGKPFVYYLDDHHGDGIVAIACRRIPGENKILIDEDPHKFYMPSYIGPRGWVALRLDLGPIDWPEVEELIRESYRRAAPAKLAAQVEPLGD